MTNLDHIAPAVKTVEPPTAWHPPLPSIVTLLLVFALAIAGTLSILAAWHLPPFSTLVESTENAYIRGKTTVISPQVSGYIKNIAVQDYDQVAQGQTLLQIDESIYRQQVAEAQANVDVASSNLANNVQLVAQRQAEVATTKAQIESAKAQLVKTQADLTRANELVEKGSVSVSSLDSARAAEDSAKAAVAEAIAGNDSAEQAVTSAQVNASALKSQVESATAQLQLANINLGYTTIVAPDAGRLSDVGARTGQYVTDGTELMFLVPGVRWVIANYKEAQTAHIRAGQRAWFYVDALDHARFTGTVERLSPATGSEFSVLRTDNAIGNFTKIPQRISVRILIDPGQPLSDRLTPGMSVESYVDTADYNSSTAASK
ncbi:HlyD family secretion protein [Rhizobium tubonense]|uniref:Secretion protein HlyD n=1 Tax=Rhizobium tubonense TaxID=484088 RepID=A0A2W4C4K7_9HYPH|nr:HlyD family secretion protein [Rhizobium tubonense]PZM08001.1 secretion protein HlyD [Rhizobium tubonense]